MNHLVDYLNLFAANWWPFLIHAAWQSTLVALLVLALVTVGRRWPSPLRYGLLVVALLKFAMPPMLSIPTGIFSLAGLDMTPSRIYTVEVESVPTMPSLAPFSIPDQPLMSDGRPHPKHQPTTASTVQDDFERAMMRPILSWPAWFMLTHCMGALLAAAWMLIHIRRLSQMIRRGEMIQEGPLHQCFLELCESLNIRRIPQLTVVNENCAPSAFGLFRPTVIVPVSLLSEDTFGSVRTVLAHELAHFRRRDLWINCLQLILFIPWWFNPVYWLLSKNVRQVREDCCDDLLIAQGIVNGEGYCETLLEVARRIRTDTPIGAALGFSERVHPLGRRLRRVLDPDLKRVSRLSLAMVMILSLTALIILPGLKGNAAKTDESQAKAVEENTSQQVSSGRESITASEVDRMVAFPEDHSVGKLFIRDATNLVYDKEKDDWVPLCDACGAVKVPAGKQLRLRIPDGANAELKALESLHPDDLQVLDFRNTTADDAGLASIAKLTGLRSLRLDKTKLTAAGLVQIKGLTSLRYLSMNDLPLGLDGLAVLEGMASLEALEIERSSITDGSLVHLVPLKQLKRLRVGGNEITDAGLVHLAQITSLTEIKLDATQVTDAGVPQLLALQSLHRTQFPFQITQDAIDLFKALPTFEMPLPRKTMVLHTVGEDGTSALACGVSIQFSTSCGSGYIQEFIVDESGVLRFAYSVYKREYISISTQKPGYVTTKVSWSDTTQPDIPSEVTLKLEKGRTIGGQVVNEEGQGIPGVKVEIQVTTREPWEGIDGVPSQPMRENDPAVTSSEGRWKVENAPKDAIQFSLKLSHPDYIFDEMYSSSGQFPVDELYAEKAVSVLKRGITVTGTILNQEGQPVTFARVSQGGTRLGTEYPKTQTDGKGVFEFKNVRPGDLVLTVQAEGYAPELKDFSLSKETPPVEFRLEPGKTIKGKIVDVEGKPVAGAVVAADTWRGHYSLEWRVDSGPDGTFCWTSAPSDEVLFDMGLKGYMSIRGYAMKPRDKEYVITFKKPLKAKGTVVEAESGQPVEGFSISRGILFEGHDIPSWDSIREPNITGNSFEVSFTEPYPHYVVKVEKPGYLPSVSRPFTDTEKEVSLEFRLEKGVGPSGILKGTDGQPLKGVDLYLITPSDGVYIRNGSIESYIGGTATVKTDDNGRFKFTPQVDPFKIIVMNDTGYVEVSDEGLKANPEVIFKPWGKVEGELRVGKAPGAAGEKIILSILLDPSEKGKPEVHFLYNTDTNSEGKFVFDHVKTGDALVSWKMNVGLDSDAISYGESIEVKAGETTHATLGGYGRPVTGRIIVPATATETISFKNYRSGFNKQIPGAFDTKLLEGMSIEEQKIFWNNWTKSEANKEYRKRYYHRTHFRFPIKEDGSFTAQDIPSGTYTLSVQIYSPINDRCGGGDPVARASKDFYVPEMPGGRSDEPFDLGELPLTMTQ